MNNPIIVIWVIVTFIVIAVTKRLGYDGYEVALAWTAITIVALFGGSLLDEWINSHK